MEFFTFYNRPAPVTCVPDTETKFVDQSEADRASLKYQLERFGMDSLQQQLQKTMSQFGYADTRLTKSYSDLASIYAEANSYFSNLPSRVRAKFGHDPVQFYQYIEQQPEKAWKDGFISKEKAAEMGVLSAMPAPPVTETAVVTPTEPLPVVTTPVEPTVPSENVSA